MARIKVSKKILTVVFIFILGYSIFLPLYSVGKNGTEVTISVLKNKELEKFGRRVFVTGVWNWINISFNENISIVSLVLYKGDTLPLIKDEENFYAWSYINGIWKAIAVYNGNEYMDKKRCKRIGNKICFRVTTENIVENDFENWTLSIEYSNNKVKIPIIMEKPMRSLAVEGGISVKVEPFQVVNVYGTHYFTTINNGNLPIVINVSYNRLNDRIVTSNTDTILSPHEESKHSIEIRTQAWKPGIIKIGGTVTGIVPDDIIPTFITSQPTIQLNAAIMLTPGDLITIFVGHNNYQLEDIDGKNITFQYLQKFEIFSNENKNLSVYLCGEGNVSISLSTKNLSVVGVWLNEERVSNYTNMSVVLNPLREESMDISLTPLQNVGVGEVVYDVRAGDIYHRYITYVDISNPPQGISQKNNQMDTLPKVLVASGIIIALVYISISYLRGRK